VQATGYGCHANAPVVLTIDHNQVARTTTDNQGTFATPIATTSLPVGRYQVLADCGPQLAASFDVVVISHAGQDGSTVVIIIFFILLGLAVFRRSMRAGSGAGG